MTATSPASAARPCTASLVARVAATRPGDARDEALVRDEVAAYGWNARIEQVPPELLLVRVKETFRGAPCLHLSAQQVEILLERAITWAIRAYYGREVCSVR